ncbi:hypothetical protein APS_1152 [Acetobacter pasteurianus subsp. pasteurianus LMG 1262 = NBRC 106471]|nr:hypothetical protein APS_1152 [Acetobacter pasteurianus subsp. pasteurianus LMG 1262 = NBRC 106471]
MFCICVHSLILRCLSLPAKGQSCAVSPAGAEKGKVRSVLLSGFH